MTPDDARSLDVFHVADLAEVPVDEDEVDALGQAMAEVLDAFELPDVDPDGVTEGHQRLFDDEPRPCDEDEVEAILDQVPRREGRHVRG